MLVKPIIISFCDPLSRHMNLNIRFLKTALKVLTLATTNISLALHHLGLVSDIRYMLLSI